MSLVLRAILRVVIMFILGLASAGGSGWFVSKNEKDPEIDDKAIALLAASIGASVALGSGSRSLRRLVGSIIVGAFIFQQADHHSLDDVPKFGKFRGNMFIGGVAGGMIGAASLKFRRRSSS